MKVQIELSDQQFERLWLQATRELSFRRVDPRKAWTLTEKKEAIRAWVQWNADRST